MCGIVGATGTHGRWIERATQCLHHRGPDRSKIYQDLDIELGHTRLAVIDLSARADQPMFSQDRSLAIILNGEIYNFREIRRTLEQREHKFKTGSDTEVLLKLFQTDGKNCLSEIKGMFAFAIWDFREKQLFLARDPLGEKPLYYTQLPCGNLLFASEIKSLLLHPLVSKEIDLYALDDYLTYLYVPGPRTIFRNVLQLMPGEMLVWRNRTLKVATYWSLPYPSCSKLTLDRVELEMSVRSLLRKSVSRMLIADVPIGFLLSGGIDSSTLVAFASEYSSDLKTFTVTFGDEGSHYNEHREARRVARHYGTKHHELLVSGKTVDLLPSIIRHFDQPFGNPTALLTYQLSQAMRREVTVAIGGDGGDEVFGGYPRYTGIQLSEIYRKAPQKFRMFLERLSRSIPESKGGIHHFRRLKELLWGGTQEPEEMYLGWVGYFDSLLKSELYGDDFSAVVKNHRSEGFLKALLGEDDGHLLDRAILCDLQSFLPFNVLEYGDKMTMAHGLELRLPFLDKDLVALMAQVPGQLKLRNGRSKYLLKRAMKNILPAYVLRRRKKGLNPPMGIWIENQLKEKVDEYLGEAAVKSRGYFNHGFISRLRHIHRCGKRDLSLHLWALVVLEEWHREYLDH